MILTRLTALLLLSAAISTAQADDHAGDNSLEQTNKVDHASKLLWGDTHLHTSYSFDAFLNQNGSADPDTAYRYAKGIPVIHPYNRARIQIETPLDFLVVSDHAELMGVIRAIDRGIDENESLDFWNGIKRRINSYFLLDAIKNESGREVFTTILPVPSEDPNMVDPVQDPANELAIGAFGDTDKTEATAWSEIVDAAERANEPGKFTSLIGWEWSSIPTGANLHRVVFTPDGGDIAKQFIPFGSDQSQYPEDLWSFLEETQEKTGARFMAIPHNPNISKGFMFAETTLKGETITEEYARRRLHWEPIAEVTQIKGDSETHPDLSPEDEFADFETYKFYIQQTSQPYVASKQDYIRSALKTGLEIEQKVGVNPYQFGFIGSTDAHTGMASAEEDNFWGKMARDSTPETKRSTPVGDVQDAANGWNMAAQGLAAVWARENTRDEIFDAFKRKETYATTGPRIAVRVFAGWDLTEEDLNADNFVQVGYRKGVPMGGSLSAVDEGATPRIMIRVAKDPKSVNLDRVQVIKGWVDPQGNSHETIYNVAWSGDRQLNEDGKLAAVGNTVNLATGVTDNSIGATELSALWQDPDFNASQNAFYYVRVLQIPTARHSLLDSLALQVKATTEGPATLQERAYTSPIWYQAN